MYHDRLTTTFTRYRAYASLVSYWQSPHDTYVRFPERYHLSKSLEWRDESQRKADSYWVQFVDMIRESKRTVSYDPVLCQIVME